MKQRNWYTIFLLSTCIVAGMIYIAGVHAPDSMKIARAALQYVFNPSEGSFSEGSFWTDGVEEEMQSTDDAAVDDLNSTDADSSEGTSSDNVGTVTSDQKLTEQTQRELPQIPDDFYRCSFLSESRTVGLSEYGKLGNADVFADTGMSVYNVTKKALPAPDGEKHTLDERLQEKNYQIILLMLGINELGYDRNVSYKSTQNW